MPTRGLRALAILTLGLSVLLAPMLPAFASLAQATDDAAAHAGHEGMRGPATSAPDHGEAHENCNDHCCLACTMHFVNIAAPWLGPGYTRSVQTPVAQHYHPYAVITPPDRPPRSLG